MRVLALDSGDPGVPVPVPAGAGPFGVRVVLGSSAGEVFGCWRFDLRGGAPQPRLLLFPQALDAHFLVLDHPGTMPDAVQWQVAALPPVPPPETVLKVEALGSPWPAFEYTLRWPADAPDLWQRWRRQQAPAATWFYVEITNHCNFACLFCPSPALRRPRQWMSLANADRIFGRIAEYWKGMDFTAGYAVVEPMVFLHVMGEPLLHPDFARIAALAVRHGLRPALFTNVSLLDDQRTQQILQSGIRHVTLSINGVNGRYRPYRGKTSLADQTGRVARFLERRAAGGHFDLHVDIQYILAEQPAAWSDGVMASAGEAQRLVLEWLPVVRRHGGAGGADAASPANAPGDPTVRFRLGRGVDLAVKTACTFANTMLPPGTTVLEAETGQCPFGNPFRQMAVFVDGSVSFCCLDHENSVNLGNLLESDVAGIWHGERMSGIRASMAAGHLPEPLCRRCLGRPVPRQTLQETAHP